VPQKSVFAVDVRCRALLNEVVFCPRIGVEVGVYRGGLSARLLSADPALHLFMVDPWGEVDESYATTDDHIARFYQADHDAAMEKALQAVAPYEGRYSVMRKKSVDAAREFKDASIDWVFIDGDHSYEGVKADLWAWWPKVRPRGLFSGHDWRDERNYGVIKAVSEFAEEKGLQVRLGPNYTWFITR
jgi:hypothetical protein